MLVLPYGCERATGGRRRYDRRNTRGQRSNQQEVRGQMLKVTWWRFIWSDLLTQTLINASGIKISQKQTDSTNVIKMSRDGFKLISLDLFHIKYSETDLYFRKMYSLWLSSASHSNVNYFLLTSNWLISFTFLYLNTTKNQQIQFVYIKQTK